MVRMTGSGVHSKRMARRDRRNRERRRKRALASRGMKTGRLVRQRSRMGLLSSADHRRRIASHSDRESRQDCRQSGGVLQNRALIARASQQGLRSGPIHRERLRVVSAGRSSLAAMNAVRADVQGETAIASRSVLIRHVPLKAESARLRSVRIRHEQLRAGIAGHSSRVVLNVKAATAESVHLQNVRTHQERRRVVSPALRNGRILRA